MGLLLREILKISDFCLEFRPKRPTVRKKYSFSQGAWCRVLLWYHRISVGKGMPQKILGPKILSMISIGHKVPNLTKVRLLFMLLHKGSDSSPLLIKKLVCRKCFPSEHCGLWTSFILNVKAVYISSTFTI